MRETEGGVLVMEVVADSPAARGGLLPGDIIRAVDQVAVETSREVQHTIFKRKIGAPAQLAVDRKGQKLALELVTEIMPSPVLMLRE
jgi:S1-C subfamily serine protease